MVERETPPKDADVLLMDALFSGHPVMPGLSDILDLSGDKITRLFENVRTKLDEGKENVKAFCENASVKVSVLKFLLDAPGLHGIRDEICVIVLRSIQNESNVVVKYASGVVGSLRGDRQATRKSAGLEKVGEIVKKAMGGDPISDCFEVLLQLLSTGGDVVVSSVFSWISLLDPELVTALPEKQIRLIFGKNEQLQSISAQFFSALPNSARSDLLLKVVHMVLSDFPPDRDPVKVVDFVTASMRLPKMWRGRDRTASRHVTPEDILHLSSEQLRNLIRYLLASVTPDKGDARSDKDDGEGAVPPEEPFSHPEPAAVPMPEPGSMQSKVLERMPMFLEVRFFLLKNGRC